MWKTTLPIIGDVWAWLLAMILLEKKKAMFLVCVWHAFLLAGHTLKPEVQSLFFVVYWLKSWFSRRKNLQPLLIKLFLILLAINWTLLRLKIKPKAWISPFKVISELFQFCGLLLLYHTLTLCGQERISFFLRGRNWSKQKTDWWH